MPRDPNCGLCPLGDFVRSTSGQVCVWNEEVDHAAPQVTGPITLFVVGQNPGREENRAGRPFIGDSGKLIRELLAESNFPYALSNAVKCHSPRNETPDTAQLDACRPYLIDEIFELKPMVILALGNPALKTLIGRSGIDNHRGQPQDLRSDIAKGLRRRGWEGDLPKVLVANHPAYVLRFPSERRLLEDDVAACLRYVNQLLGLWTPPDAEYIDSRFAELDFRHEWTFDIESTTADYRDPRFKIHLIGVDDGTGPVKILTRESDFRPFSVMLSVQAYESMSVAHPITFNGLGFDGPALRWHHNRYPIMLRDVMLLAYLVDETMPHHTLDACAIRWLGVAPWKDHKARTKEAKAKAAESWMAGPQSEEEWHELKLYNARDTRFTTQLWYRLWDMLTPQLQAVYTHLLVPATFSLTRLYEGGVAVSRENIALARSAAELEVERTLEIVRGYAEKNWVLDFNPNSPDQVRKLLYGTLGLKPPRFTPKKKPSTDQESLKILSQNQKHFDLCQGMLGHRAAQKEVSFLHRFESLIEADGRLHPDYSLINTDTGRTSSWVQQVPRKPGVRRVIVARPGRRLLSVDQSQVELRLMAWRSRDPAMMQAYREGVDLHGLIAERLVNMQRASKGLEPVPFDRVLYKEERSLAKAVNFGCLYGAEAFTLQAYLFKEYSLKVTLAEAEFLRDEVFFGTFAGLPPYYNTVLDGVKRTKQVISPFGRIRRLANIDAGDIELRAEAARQAINSPNQADASDLTLISLNLALQAAPWLDPVMFQHDANIFEVDEDRADEAAEIVVECMQHKVLDYIESYFHFTIDVPLVAEAEILQEWR